MQPYFFLKASYQSSLLTVSQTIFFEIQVHYLPFLITTLYITLSFSHCSEGGGAWLLANPQNKEDLPLRILLLTGCFSEEMFIKLDKIVTKLTKKKQL